MKITYIWKILSEDGLLKDPPKFYDPLGYGYDVNETEDYNHFKSEEEAYENFNRVRTETNNKVMEYFDFVLIKIVNVY